MLKAKVLSLYYPHRFINICSKEHLDRFAEILEINDMTFTSEIQHALIKLKHSNTTTQGWSNPKFMQFIYWRLDDDAKAPKKVAPKPIDITKVLDARQKAGEAAEIFALTFEKERLLGGGYESMINHIQDFRAIPGWGFDFCSYNSKK
jgi:hypothetical protein